MLVIRASDVFNERCRDARDIFVTQQLALIDTDIGIRELLFQWHQLFDVKNRFSASLWIVFPHTFLTHLTCFLLLYFSVAQSLYYNVKWWAVLNLFQKRKWYNVLFCFHPHHCYNMEWRDTNTVNLQSFWQKDHFTNTFNFLLHGVWKLIWSETKNLA